MASENFDGEGRQGYILRYDPDIDSGYEEYEERTVTFLDEHELFDMEEEELMVWRVEGDSWDGKGSWENILQDYTGDDLVEDDGENVMQVASLDAFHAHGERMNR